MFCHLQPPCALRRRITDGMLGAIFRNKSFQTLAGNVRAHPVVGRRVRRELELLFLHRDVEDDLRLHSEQASTACTIVQSGGISSQGARATAEPTAGCFRLALEAGHA